MKSDFRSQGHVIILIMRMSRLHIQILGTNKAMNRSSFVSSNFSFVKVMYSYLQMIKFYTSAEEKELKLWINFPKRFE